jgi:dienelactone hydrolase
MRAEIIKYPMGALTAEGALIYDENVSGKRPALLMAPNWMGMTNDAIERGRLIAASRYVVFVADMYAQEHGRPTLLRQLIWPTRCVQTPLSSASALGPHSRQ